MRHIDNSSIRRIVLAAALMAASNVAIAAAGTITPTVTPLSTTVTYSTDGSDGKAVQTFYVGYEISFKNESPNTINNVSFRGTVSVVDPQEMATFHSAEGWSCSVQPPMTQGDNKVIVSCALGTFTRGQTKGPFAIFFHSPVKDTVSPTADGSDKVLFEGVIVQQEGFNGPNSWNNSLTSWSAADVLLGTSMPNDVRTAVPKSGATVFTGDGSPPSTEDPISTKVTIPALPKFTTAKLFEAPPTSCVNSINFKECYSSELTIPGEFSPYLTIVLRQDASTFKPTYTIPNINNSLVYYEGQLVGDCPGPTTPLGNGFPCIAGKESTVTSSNTSPVCTTTVVPRDHGKGKDALKPDNDNQVITVCTPVYLNLSGYFQWLILNTKNGRFGIE